MLWWMPTGRLLRFIPKGVGDAAKVLGYGITDLASLVPPPEGEASMKTSFLGGKPRPGSCVFSKLL